MSRSVYSDMTFLERQNFIRQCQLLGEPCPIRSAEYPDMVESLPHKAAAHAEVREAEKSEMYFPDDLCELLREFTRPVFKYFQEFNAYKRTHHHDCHLLLIKLNSENPGPTLECLRDYLAAADVLRMANEEYAAHMARPRGDLTVAELLQYRVDQDLLHEESAYASWLTCWYHHELNRELIGRDIVQNEWFPYERTPLYEEDDDDYSLRRWEWTAGGWVATEVGWN